MKFVLEIELGNDAMRTNSDVRGALRAVVEKIPPRAGKDATPLEESIFDDNGNRVGWFAFAEGWSVQKDLA